MILSFLHLLAMLWLEIFKHSLEQKAVPREGVWCLVSSLLCEKEP